MAAELTPPLTAVPGADRVAVFFDPANAVNLRDGLFDRESSPFSGDKILAPYEALHARLTAAGIAVHTTDLIPAAPDGRTQIVISFGTPDRMPSQSVRRYAALARRPDVILSAFFAMECPVVEPKMFEELPALHRLFRRIMSWSDSDALLQFTRARVPVEHFCWPQSFGRVHEELWNRRDRGFLVLMNANRLPRVYVDELYTARLRAVEFFHRFGEIDLYGRNWDRAPWRGGKTRTPMVLRRIGLRGWETRQRFFPNPVYTAAAKATRGPARSKSDTISRYRFALCFENSILKGWMTEKIFDCFFAGTIPIYWGAPDILDWVPAECFIDMRHFKDFAELRAFLRSLTAAKEQGYRDAAREYLASDLFTPFQLDTWIDLVLRIVAEDSGLTFPVPRRSEEASAR